MIKICFAQEMYFPLQSTQALSAYLKDAGHQTDVAIGNTNEIVDYILNTEPDLIAFSVLTAYRNHMLASSIHNWIQLVSATSYDSLKST